VLGSDYILGGPIWWFMFALYVLVLGLAAYVSIDSWRSDRAERLAALREPAWVYRVLQPAFLAIAIAVWLPFVPRVFAAVPVGLMLFALVGEFAYLLRVVFPKQPRTAPSEEFELLADGGDTAEPESHPAAPVASVDSDSGAEPPAPNS
jgi:hypothetical protein